MKHSDDDGTLTLFADGNKVLIACNRGHYWIFDAQSSGRGPGESSGETVDRVPVDLERFGPAAIEALG